MAAELEGQLLQQLGLGTLCSFHLSAAQPLQFLLPLILPPQGGGQGQDLRLLVLGQLGRNVGPPRLQVIGGAEPAQGRPVLGGQGPHALAVPPRPAGQALGALCRGPGPVYQLF